MKSFDFNGRASRSEFWWFWMLNTVIGIIILFIKPKFEILKWILIGWVIATIPASLAAMTRRFHDVGFRMRSCLIRFIIMIGIIIISPILYIIFGEIATIISFIPFIFYISLLIVLCGESTDNDDAED
jgi:uncharacterized membrane protein YhaH (DUF805 family)